MRDKKQLAELHNFSVWLHWRWEGKTRPKPAWLPGGKGWAWQVYNEFEKKHPHTRPPVPGPKPPPANNPPSEWKNAPWCKKHVHISHGLRSIDGVWTIDQLISRCLQYGAKAIFAQFGDDCPDPEWVGHTKQLYQAGKAVGIPVGVWGRCDYRPWPDVQAAIRSVMPVDGLLADVEQRCEDQQLPEHLYDEFGDEMPLGVIATGGIDESLDESDVHAVADRWRHFDFVGQDYYKADLPLTPDTGENFVYWRSTAKNDGRGFRHLPDANNRWHVPVVMPNAETCPPLAFHIPLLKDYTPHCGVWDAELIEANGEWPVFASI